MILNFAVKYKSQRGAALLVFILMLISVSSYALLNKLNAITKPYTRDLVTSRALAQAKQVLMGYAITYPEKKNARDVNKGPGYLPCPDLDNDGNAEGGCALAGPTNRTIGRFPNRTLNIQALKDASGQRLWYVLADNFRNFAGLKPLNSNTPGQLCIDVNSDDDCEPVTDGDISDIVAIIIAPGAPVAGQNRDPAEKVVAKEISNYLEADNADLDENFVISSSVLVNDHLMFITRQELMRFVEKRVLSEVAKWLSPSFEPGTSTFASKLPWFVANDWHKLVYITDAGKPLPDSPDNLCTLATPCFTVNKKSMPMAHVRAIALSAGATLTMTGTYNDQTRIISTTP